MDTEEIRRPHVLDLDFIQRFMLIIGPISSLFDFLTFYVMLVVLEAGEKLFQTGWFVESLCTQVLVIFVIRTRGNPLRSYAHPVLAVASLTIVAIAALLPFTPIGVYFGFVPPPIKFYLILAAMVAIYLTIVELAKRGFCRSMQAVPESDPRLVNGLDSNCRNLILPVYVIFLMGWRSIASPAAGTFPSDTIDIFRQYFPPGLFLPEGVPAREICIADRSEQHQWSGPCSAVHAISFDTMPVGILDKSLNHLPFDVRQLNFQWHFADRMGGAGKARIEGTNRHFYIIEQALGELGSHPDIAAQPGVSPHSWPGYYALWQQSGWRARFAHLH